MFAITKLARYTQLRLNDFHAAMLFHVFGIITVIFAPIGMNRIIEELIDNNTDEYEEDFQWFLEKNVYAQVVWQVKRAMLSIHSL